MIKNEFKKVILFFLSTIGLLSIYQNTYSQTVQTFSVTGTQNWTCPAGITSVTVECWGAGGGSGGVSNVLNAASGGGGGGAYAQSVISVTPGNTYTILVGAGGAGGSTAGTNGAGGGASSFNSNVVSAAGGSGGSGSTSSTSLGAGGSGGAVAICIGTVKFGGGAGAVGILNLSGGGGGSSAGNSSVGNNASTNNGGAAPIGGVAGASASTATVGAAGTNGLIGGGGAAGARRGTTAIAYTGAFGGNGKVVLSYVCTPPTVTSTQTNVTCNGNNTGAVNITVSGGAPISSTPVVDQQQTTGGCGTTYSDFWQSFTPAINGLFASIDIRIYTNSPTVGNWFVYSGVGTGGALLASGTYNFPVQGGVLWKNLVVTGSPALVAGQQYTFRMDNVDWSTSCASNLYPGGTDNFSTDRSFATYMSPYPYNYTWSNSASTQDIFNLIAGTYTVTVTDANSCVTTNTTSITQPLPLSATTVVNNVLCNGGATGAINLTVSGGTTPYTFNWGSGITTEDRAGLPAGVYTCTITDVNGCFITKTSTVTQPPILSTSNVVTNVLCNGTSTGAINLTPAGGTPGYTFNWGGGVVTEDRINIPAGAYTFTITDVNSCTVTATGVVTQPSTALSANTTVTNVLCFGAATGAINLTPAGGTAPYTFNWGSGVTTEDRTGLIVGVYTCTVTDINGCVTSISSTITQPATALAASTTVSNVLCFGSATGAINLTPSGGTPGYTFNWGGGVLTEDRSGLPVGVYTCTVTDANGCLTTVSSTITQPATPITASTTVSNVLCFGSSTGAINLTPSGGVAPYIFNWGGGITTEDRTGLPAGVYTCTVTDANSCLTTVSSTITQPATPITASTTVSNVLCFGTATGSINLSASGGTIPYTFNWGGGIVVEDRINIPAGAYSCTVTDVNTCTVSVSASVTEPTVLIANAVISSSINCNGGSGVVTVNASGGTPSYSGTGTFTVVAGTYTYTVTDANGCVKTTTINVTQPAPLTITVSSSSPSICVGATASLTATGASTYTWNPGLLTGNTVTVSPTATTVYTATGTSSLGCVNSKTINLVVNSNPTITATPSSSAICSGATATLTGSGAVSYTWNPGSISGSITTVAPSSTTNYTLIGANAVGCTNTKTLSLIVDANPTVSIVASPTAICIGLTTTLTVSGANSYLWSTGATTSSIAVAPSASSVYSVTGTNTAGCVNTETINVTVNPLPSLSLTASPSSICAGTTSTLTASGANTYSWSTGSSLSTLFESPSVTTIYTVTGTDTVGCVNTETVNLTVNALPSLTVSASSIAICVGSSATLTATGATTYSWSTGVTTSSEVVSPSATTLYTVVGTDAIGCSNSDTLSLTVNTLPIITINSSTAAICSGASATLTASGANSYVWSTSESSAIIEVAPSVSTGYTVTGTDAAGCINTETISVTVNPLPTLSLTASPSSICAGTTSTLTASGANTYSWSTGSSLSTLFVNPSVTTIYTVTGTDNAGCVNTETVNLTVNALPTLTVSSSSSMICVGSSATLTATGATTYSWSSGATTSSEVVSPSATTLYTVVGTDAIGCINSDTVRIYVNSLPTISTNVNTNTICLGDVVVFSNFGANTFTLTPSALTGSTINVPMNTVGVIIYTITGTDALGCINTNTVTITTYALPSVSISPSTVTICAGQSVVLNATGANTYTWSGSGSNSNSNSITDAPTANTSYSLTGTDINGCLNSATAFVNVSNTPIVSINTPSTNVCMGYTMTISASGASSYNWSTGATTNTIVVQPFSNLTYSVVGTNGGSCSDTAFLSLSVLPLPNVNASATSTLVCVGQTVDLNASGSTGNIYLWQPNNLIGASQTVQITTPITYTAYGQGTNGCVFFSTVFIDAQNGNSVVPIATPSTVCIGDSAILSVAGGTIPMWSSNTIPNTTVVTPSVATNYTVSAVDLNGCVTDIVFTVDINSGCEVLVYNGFTPNGDGINDFWIIDNIDKYSNNKVFIYNRWGNEIYRTSNYDNVTNVWDGKMKGQTITSGTYFFVIVDGSDKLIKKGWIEITN